MKKRNFGSTGTLLMFYFSNADTSITLFPTNTFLALLAIAFVVTKSIVPPNVAYRYRAR